MIPHDVKCLLRLLILVLGLVVQFGSCQFDFEEEFFTPQAADSFEESFQGKVGGSNYTYYSYDGDGPIRLKLISLKGDADLYVGEKILEPKYEFEKHALQSATCGLDSVDVPATFKRPVGIGIYGHPSHESSVYVLQVTNLPEEKSFDELYNEDEHNYFHSDSTNDRSSRKRSKESVPRHDSEDDDDKSIAWEIILGLLGGLLKIIIEVLT